MKKVHVEVKMEEKNFAEKLAKDLKKKTIRKYVIGLLSIIIVVSLTLSLNIESKDSKLPDGQGNVITSQQDIDDNDNASSDGNTDSVPTDREDDSNKTQNVQSNKNPVSQENKKPTPEDIKVDNTKDPTASNDGNSALKPEEEEKISVTISIRCDTIANDMSKLTDKSVAPYIPSNGVILGTTTYKCTTENTVFDCLNAVCRNNNIQLDFSYEPLYEAYYIKGINYLYHFDAGDTSGWMFKVNGWFPNYGCSSYYLSDGDVIEWVYTCNLGEDVGDNYMG